MARVDSITQRSQLVAALKAKLSDNATVTPGDFGYVGQAPGMAPVDSGHVATGLGDSLAQLDRGLDARQKLIAALKANLSRCSALPKTSPQCPPPAFPQTMGSTAAVASTAPAPPLAASDPYGSPPPPMGYAPSPAPQNAPPMTPMTPSWPSGPGSAPPIDQPPRKRPKVDGSMVPEASSQVDEQAQALAARKAEMLRKLQAGDGGGAAGASTPEASSESAPAEATPAGPGAMPASVIAAAGPAPAAGASAAEYEAYRQKCWKQYYEYCAVWQKYYSKKQEGGGQPKGYGGKGAAKGKGAASGYDQQLALEQMTGQLGAQKASALMAMSKGGGKGAMGFPGKSQHAMPAPRPAPQPVRQPQEIEEDIHSKLLGL